MEYLPLFSWKGRSYGSKIVIRAFFTAFSTPDHFALLAAATLLAAGAMLGFSTVRGGALRASVGSTEASDGRLARVGRIDRALLDRYAIVLNSQEILKTLTRLGFWRFR